MGPGQWHTQWEIEMHTVSLLAIATLITGLLTACTLDPGGDGVSVYRSHSIGIGKRHGAGPDR
jgi:hypothetical protein